MRTHTEIAEGTYYLPDTHPLGGDRFLPVNIYAIMGSRKTMIVDTATPSEAEQTVAAISKIMDPARIDYIFLTHVDVDHIGAVKSLLELAPKARLVGSPTNMGKGMLYGFPMDRFAVVFPGEEIDLGDRTVRVEPSLVEDGHTNWLYDNKTGIYYTSDAFGALHFGVTTDYADHVPSQVYTKGFMMWHKMNFNILPLLDQARFKKGVEEASRRGIQQIASAHGPLIRKDLNQVFDLMAPISSVQLPPPPPLPDFLRLPVQKAA